jgi:hypothetical protein
MIPNIDELKKLSVDATIAHITSKLKKLCETLAHQRVKTEI